MKKIKFFLSLAKERDWLENMATQGYLLTNLTAGIIYTFKECEPCEKVYEVDRFAISSHPTVSELTAKNRALDIATQFGWEQVTHDEDMNYYFCKDKAGDETDEFYDDEESRRERAERYRKHFSIDQPLSLLLGELCISFLYIILCVALGTEGAHSLLWIYLLLTTFEIAIIIMSMYAGQNTYKEFCMSREEWDSYKKLSEKKKFKKVQQLRSYLQGKSEFGLSLKGCDGNVFTFEEDTKRYNYFIDTKSNLKKRMKKEGTSYKDDLKDWNCSSLKWYETSIIDAAKYNLKPVAVVGKNAIVYKRPYSDEQLPWENGNENLNISTPTFAAAMILVAAFALGIIVGFVGAFLADVVF